ncbi:MAG: hypothetical protein PHW69_00275 [Elusimicrobiaceae bacterium]|nr:hypothetical protein [Elusimicrobiaceae bacterium]
MIFKAAKKALFVLTGCMCVASPAFAEAVPYFSADVLGGQYFYDGNSGSLSANADVTASVGLDAGSWFLTPIYEGRYQSTQQVYDIVGGGTMFNQMMSHRLSLSAIYEFAYGWTVKPEAGYKIYYLNETRDEKWGTGLFDYRRTNTAVTVEHIYADPFSVRFEADLYWLKFPNYTSLESQVGGDMARELAGKDVINSSNLAFTASINGRLNMFLWDAALGYTRQSFGSQHVVNELGLFDSATRNDNLVSGRATLKYPVKLSPSSIVIPGLSLTCAHNGSNQNSYDATSAKFVPEFYNYSKARVGADAEYRRLVPEYKNKYLAVDFGLSYGRTSYPSRPVQNSAGAYGTDNIYLNEYVWRLSGSYPVSQKVDVVASVMYGNQTSNMSYEKLYVYNFNIFTYLAGVKYEF